MTTTEREAKYGKAIDGVLCVFETVMNVSAETAEIARVVMAVADDELAGVKKDRDVYKDASKDATIANTIAARKLAEQEAKTVEYRAAWIKATRERDDYQRRLRDVVRLHEIWGNTDDDKIGALEMWDQLNAVLDAGRVIE